MASLLLCKGMTYKQSITMMKPLPQSNSFMAHVHVAIAKFKSVMEIPTGYQDATGFHIGAEPANSEIKWPLAW